MMSRIHSSARIKGLVRYAAERFRRYFPIPLIVFTIAASQSQAADNDRHIMSAGVCYISVSSSDLKDKFFWQGRCKDGYADGMGLLTQTRGGASRKFSGNLHAGLREGLFLVSLPDGGSLKCLFVHDVIEGFVEYYSADGGLYTGEWAGGPEGFGVMEYSGKDTYVGHWHEGKRSGAGHLKIGTGDTYVGNFVDGRYGGFGVFIDNHGDRYEGDWVDGTMSGNGHFVSHEGYEFDGQMKSGKRDGEGTFSSPKGVIYSGNWSAGLPDGEGTLFSPDGTTHSGKWRQGCLVVDGERFSVFVKEEQCYRY